MRIIDAHHHFWDPAKNYHPWLRDQPPIPFRYGDYAAIRRRFMAEEYDQAAQGWDVAATVTMEGEWDPKDPTGEALWIADLARRTGRPQAHVAQAWLDRPDLAAALEVYQDLPIVRSVRHKPRANPGPGGAPGGMADQGFIDGFLALGRQGLHFDLQTPWWHLDEATSLAERSPDTLIVLNHTGLPADRSPDGLAGWRAALTRFAEHTHSVVKISGLGIAGRPWRLEDNRAIIRDTIEIFGPDRAMFASNFPVDGLCASFDTIWQGFNRATADLSAAERRSLFAGTAARVYGLDAVNIGGQERNP